MQIEQTNFDEQTGVNEQLHQLMKIGIRAAYYIQNLHNIRHIGIQVMMIRKSVCLQHFVSLSRYSCPLGAEYSFSVGQLLKACHHDLLPVDSLQHPLVDYLANIGAQPKGNGYSECGIW